MSARQDYIDSLRTFPARFEALVTPLSDADLDKAIPGEWSVRQIVHHVADSHMNANFRFKRALTEDRPTMPNYEQDELAKLADYALPIAPSLQLIHALHARWVVMLEALTEDQWKLTAVHPAWGECDIEEIARRYADHGENHIDQIQKTLEYQG